MVIRIEKRLREIMAIEDQGTRHIDLVALAKEVGVSVLQYKGGANGYRSADETEIVARIREIERTRCIVITSIAAVVSSMIALVGAIAAWAAVIHK